MTKAWQFNTPLSDPVRAWSSSVGATRHGANTVSFHGTLDDLRSGDDPTRVVAEAFGREGVSAFATLRGTFVTALIDAAGGDVIVARDPMGTHPLFFAPAGDCVRFATSPALLLRSADVSPAINREALADLLCRRFPDASETFFENVRRVPKGHVVRVSRGRVSVERCWSPAPTERPRSSGASSKPDLDAEFDAILDRAIARCVVPGETAILLSGGVDSGTVAARAADLARRTNTPAPLALSLGFTRTGCDERRVQRGVAAALGLRHAMVDFDDAMPIEDCGPAGIEMSRGMTWPLMAPGASAFAALIARGAALGARVQLDGTGGDEWCSVPTRHGADLLRQGRLGALAFFTRAWRASLGLSWPTAIAAVCWHAGARQIATTTLARLAPQRWTRRRAARMQAALPSWLVPDPALRRRQQERLEASLAARHARGGFNVAELRIGLEHPLASLELEESFEIAARAGVRLRHPLLDPDLVEFVCRTPADFFIRDGQLKGILRQPLAKRFPGLGFERRPKVTATTFVADLHRAARARAARPLEGFPALSRLGLLDGRRAWQALGRSFETGGTSGQCWDLLAVEAWIAGRVA